MVPYFQKLQKEGRERAPCINQWTRYLTIIVLLLRVRLTWPALRPAARCGVRTGPWQRAVHHRGDDRADRRYDVRDNGEKITDKVSTALLIIMVGIIARLPHALMAELNTRFTEATGGLVMLVVELVLLFVFCAVIVIARHWVQAPQDPRAGMPSGSWVTAVRRCAPVHPMKINAAGVMPIIAAQALMTIPMFFTRFEATRGFAAAFADTPGSGITWCSRCW